MYVVLCMWELTVREKITYLCIKGVGHDGSRSVRPTLETIFLFRSLWPKLRVLTEIQLGPIEIRLSIELFCSRAVRIVVLCCVVPHMLVQ